MNVQLVLDTQTLYASLTFVAWFYGIVLLGFSLLMREHTGIVLWGIGFVCIALGLTILLLQRSFEVWVIGIVGNTLFVSSAVLLDIGVRRPGTGLRPFGDLVIPGLAVAALVFFSLVIPRVAVRVEILFASLAIQTIRTSARLLAQARESEGGSRTALMVFGTLYSILAVVVTALTIASPFVGPVIDAVGRTPLHAVLIPGLMLFFIGAGMSQLWVHYMRVYAEARRAATVDPLTGTRNRRYVMPEIERLFQRSAREGRALACLMIDADEFKRINDTYGHRKGDAVLVQLAQRLTAAVRDYDLVGRYGGEEFIVALPELETDNVIRTAERIHESIRSTPIEGVDVSVSVGIAFQSPGDTRPEDLIHRADMALIEAKNAGKNQIKVDDFRPEEQA